LLGVALGAPPVASAGFIGVVDGREIREQCLVDPGDVFWCPPGGVTRTDAPSAPFSPFDSAVQYGYAARQTSSFSSTRIEGVGAVSSPNTTFPGRASSTFSITFDVDAETPYLLSGSTLAGNPYVYAHVSLSRGSTSLFFFDRYASFGNSPFEQSGVLVPGRYDLVAETQMDGGGGYSNFSFQLEAIPEPSTALLLASGLVAFAVRRRVA